MTLSYLIVIEETSTGYSAYCPDIPGCIATGKTKQETEKRIQEALQFHFEGLKMQEMNTPHARSYAKHIEFSF